MNKSSQLAANGLPLSNQIIALATNLPPSDCPSLGVRMHKIAKQMLLMGFANDYEMPFNVARNGELVIDSLPDVGASDFLWLCNKLGTLHRIVRNENKSSLLTNPIFVLNHKGNTDLPSFVKEKVESKELTWILNFQLNNQQTNGLFSIDVFIKAK